jgi:hypothetical protein
MNDRVEMMGEELLRSMYGDVARARPRGDLATELSPPLEANPREALSPSPESSSKAPLEKLLAGGASSGPPLGASSGDDFLSSRFLGDAARARAWSAGRPRKLTTFEWLLWKLRIADERGLLSLPPVEHEPLPADAPESARAVYEGFLLLLGLRWRDPGLAGEPAMFVLDFAAAWCGITESEAKDGRDWLRREGFLVVAGKYRRANLWLPGSGRTAAA